MLKVLASAVLLLGASSCGEPALTPPIEATTPREGAVDMHVRARVKLKATGAEQVSLDEVINLHIVEYLGARNPQVTWFLSVSTSSIVKVSGGRFIQFTADLSPGIYNGRGTYTLSDRAGVSVAGKEGLPSAAYLLVVVPDQTSSKYDQFGESCTLRVSDAARSGSVRCPELQDGGGKAVKVEWSWERV